MMGLSPKQIKALKRNVDGENVRTREVNGRELSYVEGWYVVSEANRIFGFDGWSRETIDSKCVHARETRGNFLAVYLARVRITVRAKGTTVIREGHGTGEGRGMSPGEVHDIALKAAETDATKRALATFGRPFGLELYRNAKVKVQAPAGASTSHTHVPLQPATPQRLGFHPDDTTPIPRPSHFYGRRHKSVMSELARGQGDRSMSAPPLAPEVGDPAQPRIDKSQLAIGEPKRLRDRAHLKFVASKPCLICGRQPSDPHHLRFAQPRAIGLKVSDEFTVPLCRGHHRELHQVGDEIAWWKKANINALASARELWEQTHPNTAIPQTKSPTEPMNS